MLSAILSSQAGGKWLGRSPFDLPSVHHHHHHHHHDHCPVRVLSLLSYVTSVMYLMEGILGKGTRELATTERGGDLSIPKPYPTLSVGFPSFTPPSLAVASTCALLCAFLVWPRAQTSIPTLEACLSPPHPKPSTAVLSPLTDENNWSPSSMDPLCVGL